MGSIPVRSVRASSWWVVSRGPSRPGLRLTGNPTRLESAFGSGRSDRSHEAFHINESAVSFEHNAPGPVHRSVLLNEVLEWLPGHEGAVLVDGTVGAGG